MTDSVTDSLLNEGAPRTSLCDLPAEMLWNIFSHSGLVSLMHLSATCHILRHQVHEIFTSRIEAQANKYPEVKQSLHRLGWKKKHSSWNCKCFKMMAGPCFTWSELEEQRSFSIPFNSDLSTISTTRVATAAGKTFFATSSREVKYLQMGPGDGVGHNSLPTLIQLVRSNNFVYWLYLASHDNVVAVMVSKLSFIHPVSVSVIIFNASTLAEVCQINLRERVVVYGGGVPRGRGIALTRDTMVAHIGSASHNQARCESEIEIWKVNTQNPQEETFSLLRTMSHLTAPLSQELASYPSQFCINDRFMVIFDDVVKVFGRYGGYPLLDVIGSENKTLKAMALQGGLGDHLALALLGYNADNVPELTVKLYSASLANLIVHKEIPIIRHSAPFFMKWFGDHLTVSSQQDNMISLFSWQPGLASFLTSPRGVPVLRRSPRVNRGGIGMWTANCLHLDFQGVTTAVDHQEDYGFKKVFLKTWKSAS